MYIKKYMPTPNPINPSSSRKGWSNSAAYLRPKLASRLDTSRILNPTRSISMPTAPYRASHLVEKLRKKNITAPNKGQTDVFQPFLTTLEK
jgi:hypothetical protein